MPQSNVVVKIEPDNDDLRQRVSIEAEEYGLTQKQIVKEAGLSGTSSTSSFNQWLKGKYAGDNAAMEEKIERWLIARRERRLSADSLPVPPEWVETPTGKKVCAALSYSQMAGVMAAIYGGAGVGKTKSCEHYAQRSPCVWHVELTADAGGPAECAREICAVMGIAPSGNASSLRREIVARVKGSNGLLIIDEAQFMKPRTLEVMRGIWRQGNIGVALVGNEMVYTQLSGGRRAAEFAQLFSRISKRQRLNKPIAGDINALLDAWNISGRDERKMLADIAGKPGLLRGMTETLRLASMFAHGEPVKSVHIKAAWRDLGGEA